MDREKGYMITIPYKDYLELKSEKHDQLLAYLKKLEERTGIVITGINLDNPPATCNQVKKRITFTNYH